VVCLALGSFGHGVVPEARTATTRYGAGSPVPTVHAPVPTAAADAWLVPGADVVPGPGERQLGEGISQLNAGNHASAVQALTDKRLVESPLASWATYYAALSHVRAGKPADAVRLLAPLTTSPPAGAIADLAARALAEAAEAAGDLPRSLATWAALADRPTDAPDEVLKRLAEVASKAGEGGRARAAWLRLYYDHPLSPHGPLAEPVAAEARAAAGAAAAEVLARDLQRAEALFSARRYADARAAFDRLLPHTTGDMREVAELRIAECDYFARRYRAALDRLEPWLDRASRRAEARFFALSAVRGLGRDSEYVALARALVEEFTDSSWAEDTLNDLATHHILANEDAAAAEAFGQIVERFPLGRHAPRASWRYGWWQYKLGRLAEAAGIFERAAVTAPRSDYRPSWLYWAGRAREALGEEEAATALFQLVYTDYRHSYYGRLASDQLPRAAEPTARAVRGSSAARSRASAARAMAVNADATASGGATAQPQADRESMPDPPNRDTIQRLLALEQWDEALLELRYAQRVWGTSPRIEATMAWVYGRQGDLRRGINAMKRAYPQYIADGGERLPRNVTEVIFPIAYWDLIRKYATARRLDPHIVAALIAQESTFDREARSSANAWGLMQILPSTGRRLARAEGIRRFSATRLTHAETNVRLGTRYFAGLVQRFGGVHFALASYNAGESRIVRWRAERPGLAQEEFIDDIPFPETQNYVKKILGTADDYRWLYPVKRSE
jgi:soluble lytic murein transglycosylase